MSVIEFGTIDWTRRTRQLWTGRRDGAPIGTIERGKRFTYVDLDGDPHPGYRTLEDAKAAATEPAVHIPRRPATKDTAVRPLLFTAATAALVLDGVLIAGALLLRV